MSAQTIPWMERGGVTWSMGPQAVRIAWDKYGTWEPPKWDLLLLDMGVTEADALEGKVTAEQRSRLRVWIERNFEKRFVPEPLLEDAHRMLLEQWPKGRLARK